MEENNIKALFRRGKAYLNLGDLDRAEADLKKANSLDPNDKMVQRELLILKKKDQQQTKKQQKFYANMFDKLSVENQKEEKQEAVKEIEAKQETLMEVEKQEGVQEAEQKTESSEATQDADQKMGD